jgi:hypothetical protein
MMLSSKYINVPMQYNYVVLTYHHYSIYLLLKYRSIVFVEMKDNIAVYISFWFALFLHLNNPLSLHTHSTGADGSLVDFCFV